MVSVRGRKRVEDPGGKACDDVRHKGPPRVALTWLSRSFVCCCNHSLWDNEAAQSQQFNKGHKHAEAASHGCASAQLRLQLYLRCPAHPSMITSEYVHCTITEQRLSTKPNTHLRTGTPSLWPCPSLRTYNFISSHPCGDLPISSVVNSVCNSCTPNNPCPPPSGGQACTHSTSPIPLVQLQL